MSAVVGNLVGTTSVAGVVSSSSVVGVAVPVTSVAADVSALQTVAAVVRPETSLTGKQNGL